MNELKKRWLPADETCKYLDISNYTICKWFDKKDMLAHRMGRLWKFRKEHVAYRVESVQPSVPMTVNGR